MHKPLVSIAAFGLFILPAFAAPAKDDVPAVRQQANQWRAEHRTIDMHMHIDATEARYKRALKIMDAAGLGIGINLSGGTVTPGANSGPSEFERNKALVEKICPGRILLYMNLDYQGWDHPPWWFGDTNKYPPRLELLNALDRVIGRHPETTFVCVHFANNPEDMNWVDKALRRRPNMMADLAARIPELGRHEPKLMNKLFTKYQDRILFATDFMVYDKLILGSSGDAERPTDRDAEIFYEKEWRWLETWDRDWEHMTPIQGDWTISSIGLPAPVLRKIYFDNAR